MAASARYGVIADIHANHAALQVVLAELKKENVQKILCLGDLVGYNATPGEVLEAAMQPGMVSINGNHDRYVTGVTPLDPSIKEDTAFIIRWTRDHISASQNTWLEALPRQRVIDDSILMVHGSPRHEDEYILSVPQYRENLQFVMDNFLGIQVTFFGHTHVPVIIARGVLVSNMHENRTYNLDADKVYLINPGSVGQPRDGCPLASFGIYDAAARTYTLRRVEYNVKDAQERDIAAGFNPRMAKRLEAGR